MSSAAYLGEPFRVVCLTCGEAEVRGDRDAALAFASDHEAGHVVLTPARNLIPGAP